MRILAPRLESEQAPGELDSPRALCPSAARRASLSGLAADGLELPRASSARSAREAVAEHRETADGFRLRRPVLKNIPVLGELAVLEAHDIGGDP